MRSPRIVAASVVAATTLALILTTSQSAFAQWESTGSFSAGVTPGAIAVDSSTNTVYVGGYDGRGISAVSGSSHHRVALYKSTHSQNSIRDLATDAVNHYVAAADAYGVMIVNEATKVIHETKWTYDANGVAIDPAEGLVFIGGSDEEGNDYVSSFNESTGALVHTVSVTIGIGQIAVDTATHKVYVVGYNTGAVSVINESNYAVGEFSAATGDCSSDNGGCGPDGIAVNSATGMLYVGNNEPNDGTNFISVINTATTGVVAEIPVFTAASESLDSPGNMAVDPTTNLVYSVDYGPLVVINGATNAVIRDVPLGAHAYSVQLGTVAANTTTGYAYVASGALSSNGAVYSVANVPLTLAAATPKIAGHPAVNGVLTATVGTWTANTNFAYQWKANGVPVATNGTSTTYTIAPADAGKKITFSVTGSQAGYATKTVTSKATKTVATIPFVVSVAPQIAGNLTVGSTLTASDGGWSPAATFTYQWYRAGHAISGAKTPTYVLTASDRKRKITVRAIGHAVGYTALAKTSLATAAIGYGTLTTATPVITGTAVVGQKLTASEPGWAPTKISFSYQWFINGVAIKHATGGVLKVPAAAAGKNITVQVRGTKSGYTTSLWMASGPVAIPA